MRFKKQKRHRRTLNIYSTCYGFRHPYKVLCDGTFIHHLLSNNLSPFNTISNTLSAPSLHLFTTKCVLEELKSLGTSHASSFHAARKDYKLARCEHEQKVSAVNCILEIIGEKNPEHFFVATQDIELREKCRKIPGVPVLFGLRNAVFLEQLSSFQREYLKAAEEQRLHVTDSEYKLLQKRVKSISNIDELKDSSMAEEGTGDKDLQCQFPASRQNRNMDTKDKVQFKRKKAKGPNPLSCKKKKNANSLGPTSGKTSFANGDEKSSKSRKRKRSRKSKTSLGGSDGPNP